MATRDSVPRYGQTPSSRCSLIAFLSAQRGLGDKLGPSNRYFRWHLEESLNISHTLCVIVQHSSTAVDALYRNDMSTLNTAFPSSAFDDAFSIVHFTSGWDFTKNKDFFTVC